VLGVILVACTINPWVFMAVLPLSVVFVFLRRYYLHTSRDIKRVEAAGGNIILWNVLLILILLIPQHGAPSCPTSVPLCTASRPSGRTACRTPSRKSSAVTRICTQALGFFSWRLVAGSASIWTCYAPYSSRLWLCAVWLRPDVSV
jgi:hypothetical protein